jgi:phosphoribosylformylglycinamidine synthase subunit PurS
MNGASSGIALVRVFRRKYGEAMKAKVIIMPKAAVLDPQGNAVRDAMRHLGMPEVRSVRIGKYMEIDIDGQNGDLESRLRGLCRDLLSNPVIEDYELQRAQGENRKKSPSVRRPTRIGKAAKARHPSNRQLKKHKTSKHT